MNKKTIKVGKRWILKNIKAVEWNRNQAERLMYKEKTEVEADIRRGERLIGVFRPVNSFNELLLVATFEEEE